MEGLADANEARIKYNQYNDEIDNHVANIEKFDQEIENATDPKVKQALKNAVEKITKLKQQAEYNRSKAVSEYNEHVKTVKKSLAAELNKDPQVIKQMEGKKILPEDISFEDYEPNSTFDGNNPQQHVNNYVNNKITELKSKITKISNIENFKDTRTITQKFIENLKRTASELSLTEKLLFTASGLSGIYVLIKAANSKQNLKKFSTVNSGCYQVDTKNNIFVGPCKCGFKIPFSEKNGYPTQCSTKYDPGTPLKDQVSKLPFCMTNSDNSLTPCTYSTSACQAYSNKNPFSGSCEIGKCDGCLNPDDPSCKWQMESSTVVSTAICLNPTDIVLQLLQLNDNSDQWMPTPPPPLIVLLSIIGVILILLTIIWYILFLIRKEREMIK